MENQGRVAEVRSQWEARFPDEPVGPETLETPSGEHANNDDWFPRLRNSAPTTPTPSAAGSEADIPTKVSKSIENYNTNTGDVDLPKALLRRHGPGKKTLLQKAQIESTSPSPTPSPLPALPQKKRTFPADEESTQVTEPIAKRPRQNLVSPPEAAPIPDDHYFEEFLHFVWVRLMTAGKLIRTGRNKGQAGTPEFSVVGPLCITHEIGFDKFIGALATLLDRNCHELALHSLTHQWSILLKSDILPLVNEGAYRMLCSQMVSNRNENKLLYVALDKPGPKVQAIPNSPWEAPAAPPPPAPTENVLVDPRAGSSKGKEPGIDVLIHPVISVLKEKFPIGQCRIHPNLHCYHSVDSGLHFDLDTGAKWVVWAAAIRQDNGAVGYDELPKNSNHFMYAQSIKKTPAATIHLAAPDDNPSEILQLLQGIQAIVSSAAAPPPPAYPNHFYPHPNYTAPTGPLPLYHTGQYGGYQPQYLAPPNSAPPYQPTIDMNPRLSPPPAVLASIDDWYGFSNPDEEDKVALKSLHFQVGDRLKDVPEEDWKAAGFVRLSWKRMLRIDERYRDSQHRQAI